MLSFENILELIAMTVSLVLVRFTKGGSFKWICFILIITVLNEMIIVPFCNKTRNIAYNGFSLMDMLSWFMFFILIFPTKKTKRIIIFICASTMIYSLIEIIQKKWLNLHCDSRRVYDIIVILLSVYYLYTILRKEYHNLWLDSVFWACCACIIYNSVEFINFTALSENGEYWNLKNAWINYQILQTLANTLYYSFICLAFFISYYKFKQKIRV